MLLILLCYVLLLVATRTNANSSSRPFVRRDAISDVPSLSLENWMGFPFHAPLDPLKTYEDLSSSSLPFVLKPSSPSKTLLLDGTDPTIYVTSSSVPVMMTEQGNTECYDELILEGVTEYAFVSPFLSDTKSIIFSDTSDEIHFHHGLWTDETSTYEDAASDAVRSFYDHIAPSSRVLDVGSGWCGPADLLASERDADVVALTVSEAQSFYCRSRGHRTVHANAETLNLADTFGYDSFDVSFLLESLEHISNKRDLLSRLRDVSSKLLIRTSCLKQSFASAKLEFD
eukprot:g951.t1